MRICLDAGRNKNFCAETSENKTNCIIFFDTISFIVITADGIKIYASFPFRKMTGPSESDFLSVLCKLNEANTNDG